MYAGEVKVTTKDMLEQFSKLKDGWRSDTDLYRWKVGEPGSPELNVIRPVGNISSCKTHYIREYVPENSDMSPVIVCVGRGRCPICAAAKGFWYAGTEETKKLAKSLSARDRHYWNIIPRQYDWDNEDPRCLALAFGFNAMKSLNQVVEKYGAPGAAEGGYDLIFEVAKRSGGAFGSDYKFEPFTSIVKSGNKASTELYYNDLTEEEQKYLIVDLDKYVGEPSAEVSSKLADIFGIEIKSVSPAKRRLDVGSNAPAVDVSICKGDPNVFDEKAEACIKCNDFAECRAMVLGQTGGKTPKVKLRK